MSGTDFTPRGTVNLEFWSKHLESKVFAGFDLILWPKKAGTWKQGTVFTPCNRKSALAIIESGIVRKSGKYKDGKGVRYVLKEGIEQPTKKKRRSSRKPKVAKPKPAVKEELVVEDPKLIEIDTEDIDLDIEENGEGKEKVEEKTKKPPKKAATKKGKAKSSATKKKTVAKRTAAKKKAVGKKVGRKKVAAKKTTRSKSKSKSK